MNIQKVFTFFLIIVLLLSSCTKNPTGATDDNEERILFIRNSKEFSEICTMKPNGSDIRVISHYSYNNEYYYEGYYQARWSPDKLRIVIMGGPNKESLEYSPLWLMDNEGTLLYKLNWNGFNPIWTHDVEHIIFQRYRGYFSVIGDIYSININGMEEKLIYQLGDSIAFILSDVSYNGEYILGSEASYYKDNDGRLSITDYEIVKINLQTAEKIYLTNNKSDDHDARLNQDETLIVYASRDSNKIYNIYIMSYNGVDNRQITNESMPNELATFLAWSPDGNKIAFRNADQTSGYNPYGDIFMIDIQSGTVDTLTNIAQDSIMSYVMDWK